MNNEICYRNDPNSRLFRKYARFTTGLTKHQLFRDYLDLGNPRLKIPKHTDLLLPNGFREIIGIQNGRIVKMTTVSSKAVFSRKLYPLLQGLEAIYTLHHAFDEPTRFAAWAFGLVKDPRFAALLLPFALKNPYLAMLPAIALTTSTFYPDGTDPGTTSISGRAGRAGLDEAWATVRSGAGNESSVNPAGSSFTIASTTTSNQWGDFRRFITLFDTSSLPDTDSIDDGTKLGMWGRTSNTDSFSQTAEVVVSSPASNTTIADSDYNIGNWPAFVRQATGISVGGAAVGSYNDFPFNATGRGNVSKTGISKFGLIMSGDLDNSTPAWQSGTLSVFTTYGAGQASTTNDPLLTVVHSVPASGNFFPFFR